MEFLEIQRAPNTPYFLNHRKGEDMRYLLSVIPTAAALFAAAAAWVIVNRILEVLVTL